MPPDEDRRVFGRFHLPVGQRITHIEVVGMSFTQMEEHRRKVLPLARPLTAFDFTAGGRLAILRERGYSDGEIQGFYPDLLRQAHEGDGPTADAGDGG